MVNLFIGYLLWSIYLQDILLEILKIEILKYIEIRNLEVRMLFNLFMQYLKLNKN